MNGRNFLKTLAVGLLLAAPVAISAPPDGKGPPTGGETAGNNLSFPVIWAEGVTKVLRGEPGEIETEGAYWYQWGTNGTDPDVVPASCPSDPDEEPGDGYCDDGIPGKLTETKKAGYPVADNPMELVLAYLQKDSLNTWQAGSVEGSTTPVYVDWIDWGDNLESVDWYTRSQVRTEVVLFKDLAESMTEYEMRHTSGWGINEVHGLAVSLYGEVQEGLGTQATIYSPCARLTIQKMLVAREVLPDGALYWVPQQGWTETDPSTNYINEPIFNKAVYAGGDGPGYYSAEINVKGRIIYGYTWSVRQLNDMTGGTAAGDYRITFSLDGTCGTVDRNTSLASAEILVPTEEEVAIAAIEEDEGSDTGGATGVLLPDLELTYIDVRILERGGGGGGGKPDGTPGKGPKK